MPKDDKKLQSLNRTNLVPLAPKDKKGRRKLPKPSQDTPDSKDLYNLTEDFDPSEHSAPIEPEDIIELESPSHTESLTPQEDALIQIYLSHPTLPKYDIATLAGYKAKSKKVLIAIFNRVIGKWERAGHAKEIFRKTGMGEARVALRMKELMMQNDSLPVAKDMVVHASKILEMVGAEYADDGFQVVVVRADKQAKPADTGPHRKAVRDDEEKEQITK